MRYIEIILKLSFLGLSIFFLVTQNIMTPIFQLYLVICVVLGLVLLLNKDDSYHIKQTKKDHRIRQIEGGIMIFFATIVSGLGF